MVTCLWRRERVWSVWSLSRKAALPPELYYKLTSFPGQQHIHRADACSNTEKKYTPNHIKPHILLNIQHLSLLKKKFKKKPRKQAMFTKWDEGQMKSNSPGNCWELTERRSHRYVKSLFVGQISSLRQYNFLP